MWRKAAVSNEVLDTVLELMLRYRDDMAISIVDWRLEACVYVFVEIAYALVETQAEVRVLHINSRHIIFVT